jgi:hypothetical protein
MKERKWLVVLSAVLLICALATAVLASEPIKLVVNGKEIKPDVAPQIVVNRTMVPVRWIAEALGAEVEWDADTRTVIITTKTRILKVETVISNQLQLVEDFGKSLKNVSLLAPEDAAAKKHKRKLCQILYLRHC